MFENVVNFFKRLMKSEKKEPGSKDAAKERLHLVLMQDRANVSADFLELMKQEIIEVIKKYIEVDEKEIDVRLTNKENEDGTNGAPALYANIPILNIKNEMKKEVIAEQKNQDNDNVGTSIAHPEETQEIAEVKEEIEEVKQEEVVEQAEKEKEIVEESSIDTADTSDTVDIAENNEEETEHTESVQTNIEMQRVEE